MNKRKQLERELTIAKNEIKNLLDDHSITNHSEFINLSSPFADEIQRIESELRLIQHPVYLDLPAYGELITLDEFIRNVESGKFINYDGSGKYSNGTQITNIIIHPSDIKNNIYRRDFTHVLWLEKEI